MFNHISFFHRETETDRQTDRDRDRERFHLFRNSQFGDKTVVRVCFDSKSDTWAQPKLSDVKQVAKIVEVIKIEPKPKLGAFRA